MLRLGINIIKSLKAQRRCWHEMKLKIPMCVFS